MCRIKFKKMSSEAVVPSYGTDFSAGADLYALLDSDRVTVAPGDQVMIHTGICLEIPEGYAGFIFARSGLASKRGLAPANKVGVVDADYRGEVVVALHNHTDQEQSIEPKERIAQMVFVPYVKGLFEVVDNLDDTTRGTGGFGSTGVTDTAKK